MNGGVAKDLSQLTDGGVQVLVKFYECIRGPEPLPQLFPSDHLTGMFQQQNQRLEGLLMQRDPAALLTQLA